MTAPIPGFPGIVEPNAVQDSAEFQRILNLPRRDWEVEIKKNDLYKRMSNAFKLPRGEQELYIEQAASLADAHDQRGGIFPLSVGEGKTLVCYLLPIVLLGIKRPLLLAPASLEQKTWREFKEYHHHWLCPPAFSTQERFEASFLSYQTLSRESGKDILNTLRPDMIISDECFTGDTLVQTPAGTVRIETLRAGDLVIGGDGQIEIVQAVRESVPSEILCVEIAGQRFRCTPNHPFLTDTGWVYAKDLQEGSSVVRLVQGDTRKESGIEILLPELRYDSSKQPSGGEGAVEQNTAQRAPVLRVVQEEKSVFNEKPFLFSTLLSTLEHVETEFSKKDTQQGNVQKNRTGEETFLQEKPASSQKMAHQAHDGEQPDAVGVCSKKSFTDVKAFSAQSENIEGTRRKRACHAESTAFVGKHSEVEHGTVDSNRPRERSSLYARHLQFEVESSSGSGRKDTQHLVSEKNRSREGRVFTGARLARVSRIERGGVEQRQFRGRVYNLQVGGSHTYVVGDGIVVHNCHFLANPDAACTRRVDRFMLANPETVFCGMSGTITKRSIADYWHLMYWALRDGMPLPKVKAEMERWGEALDEKKTESYSRRQPGVLLQFCTEEERQKIYSFQRTAPLGRTQQMPFFQYNEILTTARLGYQRRLVETPGIVCSKNTDLPCSLVVRRLQVDPGPEIKRHLDRLRQDRITPNGDIAPTPMDVWRHARELACGFFYRWVPPPPKHWANARSAWNWYVGEILTPGARFYDQYRHLHLDSPLQVAHAVSGHEYEYRDDVASAEAAGITRQEFDDLDDEEQAIQYETQMVQHAVYVKKQIAPTIVDEHIRNAYLSWVAVRNDYKVNVVAEWLSDATIQFCVDWVKKNGPGIIWTEHRAFGTRLAEVLGTGFCAQQGLDANKTLIDDYKGRTVVASVAANKEGRNLQKDWNKNLIVTVLPTGRIIEQLIGRTHRKGQKADTVYVDWIAACDEQDQGFRQMLADAKYIQDSTRQKQKLLYADRIELCSSI